MKTPILNLLMLVVLMTLSCKKDKEEPKPTPTPGPEPVPVVKPAVKKIEGIELYNQVLDTTINSGYNFYNITEEKYGNALDFPIELAFVHNQPSDNSTRHLLGSAKADIVKLRHGVPTTNNTKTTFYVIDDSNSSLLFDTIQYSESVTTLFKTKTTLAIVSGESDAIQSDGFGWDKGEIFGFKLTNGKQGFIKLVTKPTGSKDENGNIVLGKVVLDIKMEQ